MTRSPQGTNNQSQQRFMIDRVFNHNVVLARSVSDGAAAVLLGKGIGFNRKPGDFVSPASAIERVLWVVEKNQAEYHRLLQDVSHEVIGVTEEIILLAEKKLGPLNNHLHIALADHLNFTLQRIRSGLVIENPFLSEVEVLYPEEFILAEKAAALIQDRLGLVLPRGEIGFIAMHINAARTRRDPSGVTRFTALIHEIICLVRQEFDLTLANNDLDYIRLVTHLHFALEAIANNRNMVNPLLSRIREEFSDTFCVARRIGDMIAARLGKTVGDDEVGYLTLHLQKLKMNSS